MHRRLTAKQRALVEATIEDLGADGKEVTEGAIGREFGARNGMADSGALSRHLAAREKVLDVREANDKRVATLPLKRETHEPL